MCRRGNRGSGHECDLLGPLEPGSVFHATCGRPTSEGPRLKPCSSGKPPWTRLSQLPLLPPTVCGAPSCRGPSVSPPLTTLPLSPARRAGAILLPHPGDLWQCLETVGHPWRMGQLLGSGGAAKHPTRPRTPPEKKYLVQNVNSAKDENFCSRHKSLWSPGAIAGPNGNSGFQRCSIKKIK